MTSTALTVVDPGGYLVLSSTPAEVGEIIGDALGGEQLDEFSLPRVKVPSGGATTWEVPTLGGLEPSKTLTGILVHFKRTRAYWEPDADSGTPPACRAEGTDAVAIGVGDPGGPCITCPMAQFGTAVDDKGQPAPGQACNAKEIWFLLQPDSYLPTVVSLPATSLKAAKDYRVSQLAAAGVRPSSVVTEITLAAQKNAKGDSYAVISARVAGRLDPEEAARAAAYAAELRPVFDAAAAAVSSERAADSTADED